MLQACLAIKIIEYVLINYRIYISNIKNMFILGRKKYESLETKHITHEKYYQGSDYSSVAYWYQLEPHKALPELPDVNSRLPKRGPEHGLCDY